MSKVLGYAAMALGIAALVITGVGLFATPLFMASLTAAMGGITAGMLSVAAGVLSIGASLLAPRPKAPGMSSASLERLNMSLNPHAFRTAVFGKTAFATDICNNEANDVAGTEDDQEVHRWVVVASHKVNSIQEIWLDNEQVWTVGGGVIAKYATDDGGPYLEVQIKLEGTAANYVNAGSRVTPSTLRYTGMAYVYFHFYLNSTSPFSQGIPTRCTIIGEGMPVYDPRKDSTVTGGSGTQRADDQTTWSYSVSGNKAGENPACQLGTWLLGWKIGGKLAVGKGIPKDRIDWPSFITAANVCDETQTLVGGGTSKRYTSGGIATEGDDVLMVVDRWKAAMNATLDDVDGAMRLQCLTNDLGFPIADFTEDDIIDAAKWRPFLNLTNDLNIVRGNYVNPDPKVLYQMDEYPEVKVASRDAIDRIENVNYDMVQLMSQAERLSKQRLQRVQFPGVFQATYKITAWKVQKGDIVRQTFGPYGMNQRLFRVVDLEHRWDGYVPLTLREENALIYAWDNEDSPAVVHAPISLYSNAQTPWQNMITGQWSIPGAGNGGDANMLKDAQFGSKWLKTALHFKRVMGTVTSATWPFAAELKFVGQITLGRPAAVTATSRESLSIVGGRLYYFRVLMARSVGSTGATGNLTMSCVFKTATGGTVAGGLSQVKSIPTITADGQYYQVVFSVISPATAARIEDFKFSMASNSMTGFLRLCKPWVSDKEPGADISVTISGPTAATITYAYTGVVDGGQLPKTFNYKLTTPSGDVTSGVVWTYKVVTGGANGFTSASGAQAMTGTGGGVFTLNTLEGSVTDIDIFAVYNGKNIGPYRLRLTKLIADAPVSGGGGGGAPSSQSSGFGSFSTTTFEAISSLQYTTPAGVTSAILSANIEALPGGMAVGGWTCEGKWQKENTVGGGVWTDVGTVAVGDSAVEDVGIPGEPMIEKTAAALVKSVTATGLPASTLCSFRFVGRVSIGGTKIHSNSGTTSVTS